MNVLLRWRKEKENRGRQRDSSRNEDEGNGSLSETRKRKVTKEKDETGKYKDSTKKLRYHWFLEREISNGCHNEGKRIRVEEGKTRKRVNTTWRFNENHCSATTTTAAIPADADDDGHDWKTIIIKVVTILP